MSDVEARRVGGYARKIDVRSNKKLVMNKLIPVLPGQFRDKRT
jgi:hypothetical protein